MSDKKFAAFIMTYEREDILPGTIEQLFNQSLPPEKILIVDNSSTRNTERAISELNSPRIEYHRVGYNAGPAGAAKIGLTMLAKEGYKWIYWGDDDDPPYEDCFDELIELAESYQGKCGQVGLIGHTINRFTGLIQRTSNEVLQKNHFTHVDNIAGGSCKIVRGQAILEGVLPDERLFFGFEELDFDLSMKKAGYEIIVHNKFFLQRRKDSGRLNYKKVYWQKKDEKILWREYYSYRNMLFILKKNKYYFAVYYLMIRSLLKSVLSYKYGFKYGVTITRNTIEAIIDFYRQKLNQRVLPVNKTA